VSALPPFAAEYGTAPNPLAAVSEPCPECAGSLVSEREVDGRQIQLAAMLLEPEAHAHWSKICAVVCVACGWVGSSFREAPSVVTYEERKAA
jgi:hypothetical protein